MNILVLNYEFPPLGGGASPVSMDISVQLCKRGHKVTVLTMGYKGLREYENIEGVRVHRLKCLRTQKSVCKPWEQFTYLIAVRHYMRIHLSEERYDVCHVHFVIPTGEAARWIRLKYHIPYIITAHGSDVEGHNQKVSLKIMHRMLRGAWRRIVKCSIGVVAPSEYLMNLMRYNYPQGQYYYIPNGIELGKYKLLSDKRNKQKSILVMGRLQKFKGVQFILEAIAKIDLQGWRVDILGEGPYRDELEKISRKLDLSDSVFFRGWIDYGTKEQLDYLKKASIYISASQCENCPMSVIEATAAGCYPLLSNILPHRQLIKSDEYFFDANDISDLASKLEKCITEGFDCLDKIPDVSQYDWNNVIRQYEILLQNTAAQ